jgi:4-amino-4-deoxy-L-arabinose transferase-like glycosyltransferase
MFAFLRRKPLLCVMIGALAIRCGAAIVVQTFLDSQTPPQQFVIAGDANGYWELGQKISRGDTYEVHGRKILRMPGFPMVLALAIGVGQSVTGGSGNIVLARVLLAVVGTAACFLVYRLGEELFGRPAGLLAAVWVAISPTLVGFGALILSETLFALTMLLTLITGLKTVRAIEADRSLASRLGWGLLAGIATATGVYVRPGWMLAAPAFCVALLMLTSVGHRRAATGAAIVLLIGLTLTLLPWAWRNHNVSGHWVFTTLWAGPSLYDGLNPNATGDSNMSFIENDQPFSRMNEYEVDRHYRDRAIMFARENPGRTFQLAIAKLVRYWSPVPNARQFSGPGMAIIAVLSFVPLLVLAIRGGWVFRRNLWVLLLTAGPIFYFAAIHSVFVGSVRYRLPAEYPLSVLAAAGLCNWLKIQTDDGRQSLSS